MINGVDIEHAFAVFIPLTVKAGIILKEKRKRKKSIKSLTLMWSHFMQEMEHVLSVQEYNWHMVQPIVSKSSFCCILC